MSLVDLIALCLAADACLTAWFHGDIFATALAAMDARDKAKPSFVTGAMTCPRCLAYHVPFWLAFLFFGVGFFLAEPWALLLKLPVYGLAATTVSHLLQKVHPRQDPEDTD